MSCGTTSDTLSNRTRSDAAAILSGARAGRLRTALLLAGPAVIASIAYMDPGNYATNIQAGARYGYALLWVVVMANFVAMLFQALSAKLGIVTRRNLAELCHDRFPRAVSLSMWVVGEIAAMATDLAEFLGGAIGLSLLFGLPLLVGMLITGAITYGILLFEQRGFRPLELVVGGLVGVIALCFLAELFIAPISWGEAAAGAVTPLLPDAGALTIAVGIIGATVMPHAIYLHSGLTQDRVTTDTPAERRRLIGFSNREVIVALGLAGLVNLAMVIMAASTFHDRHPEIAEIETAYRTLAPLLGSAAAGLFLLSLLASGISSSVVGTMAGQIIMQGFVGFRIPVWLRRLVTMVPAFVVVGLGINATDALVWSQVVLSIVLPVPLVALLLFTGDRALMGEFRNSRLTQVCAILGTVVIIGLNVILVLQAAGVAVPGLAEPG